MIIQLALWYSQDFLSLKISSSFLSHRLWEDWFTSPSLQTEAEVFIENALPDLKPSHLEAMAMNLWKKKLVRWDETDSQEPWWCGAVDYDETLKRELYCILIPLDRFKWIFRKTKCKCGLVRACWWDWVFWVSEEYLRKKKECQLFLMTLWLWISNGSQPTGLGLDYLAERILLLWRTGSFLNLHSCGRGREGKEEGGYCAL